MMDWDVEIFLVNDCQNSYTIAVGDEIYDYFEQWCSMYVDERWFRGWCVENNYDYEGPYWDEIKDELWEKFYEDTFEEQWEWFYNDCIVEQRTITIK